MTHLTITPISKDLKSDSYIDYNEQLQRVTMEKCNWCWDDSKYNKSKPGEFFAFYFHGLRVVIHKIESVKPPSCRLPSWSKNVGQRDRNVLELSAPLKEIGWTEWQLLRGPESKMGTYTTDDLEISRPLLYNMLMNIEQRRPNIQMIIEEEEADEEEAMLMKRIETLRKIKSLTQLKKRYMEEYNEKIRKIDEELLTL